MDFMNFVKFMGTFSEASLTPVRPFVQFARKLFKLSGGKCLTLSALKEILRRTLKLCMRWTGTDSRLHEYPKCMIDETST